MNFYKPHPRVIRGPSSPGNATSCLARLIRRACVDIRKSSKCAQQVFVQTPRSIGCVLRGCGSNSSRFRFAYNANCCSHSPSQLNLLQNITRSSHKLSVPRYKITNRGIPRSHSNFTETHQHSRSVRTDARLQKLKHPLTSKLRFFTLNKLKS